MHITLKKVQANDENNKIQEVHMSSPNHPKPDDRSNNVERIREIVRNTEENLHEAEISMEFADPMQSEMMREKNERRRQSIEELKEEMKDEITARKKGKA